MAVCFISNKKIEIIRNKKSIEKTIIRCNGLRWFNKLLLCFFSKSDSMTKNKKESANISAIMRNEFK